LVSEPSSVGKLETCARCARRARDADDRETWATIGEAEICPGCLTLTEVEALRNADR
jgi:hypothetical protein